MIDYNVPAEPTVLPPVIVDLCTIVILHRFQSPAWWNHIVKHVSADFSLGDAFDQVVRLQVRICKSSWDSTLTVLLADWSISRICALGCWQV